MRLAPLALANWTECATIPDLAIGDVGIKIDDLLVLDQLAGDVADDGEAEGGSGDGPVQRRQVVGRKGNAPAATLGRSAAGFLRSRP